MTREGSSLSDWSLFWFRMKSERPLVSVIIRCFNREDTLERAIRSVLAQTLLDYELIVIDDGSTDGSAEIARKCSGVKYFYQENEGLAGARESGLRQASGTYVAYLDADDFWDENYLKDAVDALVALPVDFVFSNWRTRGPGVTDEEKIELHRLSYLPSPEGHESSPWQVLSADKTREIFMAHQPAAPSGTVFRRERLSLGFNTRAVSADDWVALLGVILDYQVSCAFRLEQAWTRWIDGRNICEGTSDMGNRARNEIHDVEVILHQFDDRLSETEKRRFQGMRRRSHFDLGHILSKSGRPLEAMRHLLSAWEPASTLRVTVSLLKVPLNWVRNWF